MLHSMVVDARKQMLSDLELVYIYIYVCIDNMCIHIYIQMLVLCLYLQDIIPASTPKKELATRRNHKLPYEQGSQGQVTLGHLSWVSCPGSPVLGYMFQDDLFGLRQW